MIFLLLVTSNVALVIFLFHNEFSWEQFLVAMCSIFAVADIAVPKEHPVRELRALPVAFLVIIMTIIPLPHVGDHEIVIRHATDENLVDKRSIRNRVKNGDK